MRVDRRTAAWAVVLACGAAGSTSGAETTVDDAAAARLERAIALESTLAGGARFIAAGEAGERVTLCLSWATGWSHAPTVSDVAALRAAVGWCTVEPWSASLRADTVRFEAQVEPAGVGPALEALGARCSGEGLDDEAWESFDRATAPTLSPSWRRLLESAHPRSLGRRLPGLDADAEVDFEAVTTCLRERCGPEGSVLVVVGAGDVGSVHRLATVAFAGWTRAVAPWRPRAVEPTASAVRRLPTAGRQGWLACRVTSSSVPECVLEAAFAEAAGMRGWPRVERIRGERLLAAPLGEGVDSAAIRSALERPLDEARRAQVFARLRSHVDALQSDPATMARVLADAFQVEGDAPSVRLRRWSALLRAGAEAIPAEATIRSTDWIVIEPTDAS